MNTWLKEEKLDPKMREEILKMTPEEIKEAFGAELSFGTGGMRGIVGPGTNRMNIYVLRRTNYAYGKYLLNKFSNPSAVIAYDSRHFSLEFARDSANVLASLGVKVYLFNKITPTPELSFAIRYLKAKGGIVITASHNPPQYNGYKVYDDTGTQLVPRLVDELSVEINNAPNMFDVELKEWSELVNNKMINLLDDEIDNAYLAKVKDVAVHPHLDKKISLVYTPLHGTGGYLANKILTQAGYTYTTVNEQMKPDPEFSTVKSPNPENIEAFTLSKALANYQYDLLVATDPDADRIGVCVLHQNDYRFLTGNQLGVLMIDYLCRYRHFDGTVFNTIVTSDLGAEIARKHNLEVISTLTGFKYIGEQAALLEAKGKKFFFGYEESFGYIVSDFVRDKDSLQSMLLLADMANFYHYENKTLIDRLNEIYKEYSYYYDGLTNIVLEGLAGQAKIKRILEYFRTNKFPFKIIKKEDFLVSRRYILNEDQDVISEDIIALPQENVLKFYLEDYSWFILRPSGTEPKMKIYYSFRIENHDKAMKLKEKLEKTIMKMIESVA